MAERHRDAVQVIIHAEVPADYLPRLAGHIAAALSEELPKPPCEGGVLLSTVSVTSCVNHVVHYIDTHTWECTDHTFVTNTTDRPTEPPVPC